MISRSVKYLYVVGAALIVSGCASITTTVGPTRCPGKSCDTDVRQNGFWHELQYPPEIVVEASRPVEMKWTLVVTGALTKFHPTKGIEFQGTAAQYFNCRIDERDNLIYRCTNNGPAGRYEYKIRTVGLGSPPDRDPFVVNN